MDYVKLWVRTNFNVPSSGRKRRRKRGSRREWIRDAVEDADREKNDENEQSVFKRNLKQKVAPLQDESGLVKPFSSKTVFC